MEWETYAWEPDEQPRAQGARGAGISALARRLMARERATARRSSPAHLAGRLRPRRSAAQRQRPQDGSPNLFVGDE